MKATTNFGLAPLLVLGAGWILVMVLAGFFGLLGLLFTASVAAALAVSDAIAPAMAAMASVFMAILTWFAVGRMANTQQRLATRLAPSHSLRRAGRGTLSGLLIAWLVCTFPTALLFAALQQGHAALALVCGTACILSLVAAAACAWQGRLPWPAMLPALIGLAGLFVLGVQTLGDAWTQVPWGLQLLVLALGLAMLPGMLLGTARAGSSPAQRFARWKAARLSSCMFRYQRILKPSETSNLWFLMIPAYQANNWKWLGWERDGPGYPSFLLFVFLIAAFYSLFCTDLHHRFLLAPGRARRNRFALRIVGTTLRLTLSVALVMAAIPVLLIAAWEGGFSVELLYRVLSIMAVILPLWVLAVVAATWLRGLEGPSWRPWVAGAAALGLACLALVGLTMGLGLNQGPAVLCVALLGCALLMPLAQRGWQHRDLAGFMPRRAPPGSDEG
jgi:hypothetical protein